MSDTLQKIEEKVEYFFDNSYFEIHGPPACGMTPEMLTKLLTGVVVNLCASWWSIKELTDYIKNRKDFKESVNGYE